MDKLRMESPDMTAQNIDRIATLFPNCITEMLDEEHSTPEKKVYKRAVNFELLKQMLSPDVVDGDEAYEFTWVGKKAAIVEANKPIRKTLRPCVAESKDWDNTENLYIEGDNLEVLKLLQESYLGKVKMIYIDPPYNTGNDFIYADDFMHSQKEENEQMGMYDEDENRLFKNTDTNGRFHSDWCSMIYSRLMLARNLLADDGVIFISIDDNEVENLKKICNEIYGERNYITEIAWQCLDTIKNDAKYFSDNHEYILVYAKLLNNVSIQGVKKGEKQRNYYKNYDNDPRGDYLLTPLHAKSGTESGIYTYTFSNGQTWTPPQGTYPRFSVATLKSLEDDNRVYLDPKGIKTPQKKTFLSEVGDRMPPVSFWDYASFGSTRQSNKELSELINKGMFQNSKPVKTVQTLIDLVANNSEAIVLDFFSGSATTAHAVMQLNAEDGGHRKFIMVQLPEKCAEASEAYKAGYKNICEIGKERIRRAGEKIVQEQAHLVNSTRAGALQNNKAFAEFTTSDSAQKTQEEIRKGLDVGFRVLKLDDTNMKDVYYAPDDYDQGMLAGLESNIKDDRTDLDLLFGCLIDWGLPLSLPYKSEQIDGCTVHTYNDGDLIACFDANIPESVVKEIAKRKPLRAVFRDSGFASSPEKINVFEIFKLYMPEDANDITKRVRVI